MKKKERGQVLILVLILLALGALLLTPTLSLNNTALKSKRIQTQSLKEFYAMSGGMEYGIWQLLYGDPAALPTQTGEVGEKESTIVINGVETTVILRLQVALGDMEVTGAEGNRIRTTVKVVCEITPGDSAFDDDCLGPLPTGAGMRAKYTVFLDQVSPDTSKGLTAVYDELGPKFRILCNNGSLPSGNPPACASGWVTSADGSLPEITTVTPTDIQPNVDEIWQWQLPSPVFFQKGQVKQFTFTAQIDNKNNERYCNGVFLKLQDLPREKNDKVEKDKDGRFTSQITEGSSPPAGCGGGGTMIRKYVDRLLALPNQVNTFTYIINIENIDQTTVNILQIKDVLAQGGFSYCDPTSTPPCDAPRYKRVANPFVVTDGFNLASFGGTVLAGPSLSLIPPDNRQQLIWNTPGGSDSSLAAAGNPTDTFILRFQARITPTESGSYYNEIFADINCSNAGINPLLNYGAISTSADYCGSYSWPSGGVAVPTYDVRADALRFSGQGNVTVDWSTDSAQLNSWHVN